MNKEELKIKLDLLGVKPKQYSLNGELEADSIILFHYYNNWQVFYLDERGGRNNQKDFPSENEACWYIYKLFEDAKKIEEQFGIRT
jgi:hypothetical protein